MKRWLLPTFGLSLACHAGGAADAAPISANGGEASVATVPASVDNPMSAYALPPDQRAWLQGSVEETLAAGPYTYLRVRAGEQPAIWIASLAITTPSSPRVRVRVLGRAEQFHSRRLARDFKPLLFGVVRAANADTIGSSKGIE